MATATKKKTARRARADRDVIRSSQPSGEAVKRSRLPRLTRVTKDYVDSTLGNKSGYATFRLEVGDVTYRALTFGIVASAAIADVTVEIAGTHYVKIDKLGDYLDEVRVVADGTIMQALGLSELVTRNAFVGVDFGPVYTGFAYPGENTYSNQNMIDAFALGTQGLKSLTLELQLKAAFDEDTMSVEVYPHAVDMVRQIGFTYKTERTNTTFTSAGKHTYWDLPIGDDIANIWLFADGISHIKFEVDNDTLFDMSRAAYEAYLIEKGRDVEVLNGNWFLDMHAEGTPRSVAALDRAAERRRDARIKVTVTTTNENTPVEFLITQADIWNKIR